MATRRGRKALSSSIKRIVSSPHLIPRCTCAAKVICVGGQTLLLLDLQVALFRSDQRQAPSEWVSTRTAQSHAERPAALLQLGHDSPQVRPELREAGTNFRGDFDGVLNNFRLDVGATRVEVYQRQDSVCQLERACVEQLKRQLHPDRGEIRGPKVHGPLPTNGLGSAYPSGSTTRFTSRLQLLGRKPCHSGAQVIHLRQDHRLPSSYPASH
jgi:hypothetical protein